VAPPPPPLVSVAPPPPPLVSVAPPDVAQASEETSSSPQATVSSDENAVATGSLASFAPAESSSSQAPDTADPSSQVDPYTSQQNSSPYTPPDGSAPFTPSGADPGADSFTCVMNSDPYTGGQSADPYSGGQTADPYSGGQTVAAAGADGAPVSTSSSSFFDGGQTSALNYTPADGSAGSSSGSYIPADVSPLTSQLEVSPADGPSSAATGDGPPDDSTTIAAAGMLGNYRAVVGDALLETYESGTLGGISGEFVERYGVDALVDVAEGYDETGKLVTLEEEAEGLRSTFDATHNFSQAEAPEWAMAEENLGAANFPDHFLGDHASDWTNNPAEFRNPDYNIDPVAEAELGEPNLNVVSESEVFGEGEVRSSAIDWFGEGEGFGAEAVEGEEVLEGLGAAAEVGEGLELADLAWLGLLAL